MRRFSISISVVVVGILALAFSVGAQAPDPFAGSWKLDVAKSKLAGPAPKSVTVTIERMGAARKVAVDSVDAADAHLKWGYTSGLDGKDAPVTGNPAFDTVSGTETSPRDVAITYKKAGKVVSTLKSVVSADGKTLTVTTTAGESTTVQVYTKR